MREQFSPIYRRSKKNKDREGECIEIWEVFFIFAFVFTKQDMTYGGVQIYLSAQSLYVFASEKE
ncbi:hypothetical protein ABD95_11340 [Bacillus paranthracis]|nr:hypothetical protein [Bacillus paranthracis]